MSDEGERGRAACARVLRDGAEVKPGPGSYLEALNATE